MNSRLKECEQYRDRRSNPSVSEKGKTFQIKNDKKIEVACIRIDNCVFGVGDGIKCDYLFEVPEKKKLFYVELKGSDIIAGIRQIAETLKHTKEVYPGWVYEARIVAGGRVPSGISNRKEIEELRRICNGGKVDIHHKHTYIENIV